MAEATSTRLAPAIEVHGERLSVHFDDFSLPAYELFLRVKALPEYELEFLPETESYRISAPARFAKLLGVEAISGAASDLPYLATLFDDQLAMTRMSLAAKRFAVWSDCGGGKTVIGLEFARHVAHRAGGRVLIFTLNDLVNQWISECAKFYGDTLPIYRIKNRADMKLWASGHLESEANIAVTNYEKMNFKGDDDQVVNELRYLAGVVLDESSRLKAGGGKQKWALIKSCKGIEYKLSLTATPAPNDTIEFASQASFLEKMRSDGEIIWTYFQRNEKTHRWDVKPHARKAFFEFMSAWSIYVRDPRRYGWRKNMIDVPPPQIIQHNLQITEPQIEALQKFTCDPTGQYSLIDRDDRNAIQSVKLSQIAKGFMYKKGQQGKFDRIDSVKPAFVADLTVQELERDLQVLIWTVFDAESLLLAEELAKRGVEFDQLHGSTKPDERLAVLSRFVNGESRVLVSKAELLGFGMNFQCCGSMIFSGFSYSYESWYQAIRRAVRYGQSKSVRVHMPIVEQLEGDMLENLLCKQEKHEAAIADMERNYIEAQQCLSLT